MSVLKTYGENVPPFVSSKTWKINGDHIGGFIDGMEAFAQAVDLVLTTERYEEIIYSWDYGTEFADLIGERKGIIEADIERRITEALEQDDRFISVEDFEISFDREVANIKFIVNSVFGNISEERSVSVG